MDVADFIESLLSGHPADLYLDGRWTPASGGATFAVEDPATGKVVTEVAEGTPADGQAALAAADAAQESWGATTPRERADVLRGAFDLITERADDFARLMTA